MLIYEALCSILEQMENILVDITKIFEDISWRSLDNILCLRNSNSLKLNSCHVFDLLDEFQCLLGVESNASTCLSSSCSSAWSVDISLSIFWWFNLNDELNVLNIKASSCDICGNEYFEFTLLESLHCYFSLVLCDVSMHHFNLLLDFVWQYKRVCILLCLSEHDCFCVTSIAHENVSKCRHSILVWAIDCKMEHFFCCFVF